MGPLILALLKWEILAEPLQQLALHVPPFDLSIGMSRMCHISLASSRAEAGPLAHQRPDPRNDLGRNYITADRVRRVISRDRACAYLLEPH